MLNRQSDFLNNKTAIVTGGNRGIGYAIAEALASAGASVAIGSRKQSEVEQAAQKISKATNGKVIGIPVDVSSSESVENFFQRVDKEFGKIDILINNAGLGVFRSVGDLTVEDWKKTIDTNLTGVFYCSHEALARMRKSGGGFIINISSLAGRNPFAGGAAYNASKFALNGFSEAMMLDHRNENIRVSYIMPGSVDTDFSPRSERASWKIAPEDVAQVVIHLLSMPERTLVSRVEMRPSKPPKAG
jgi:NAD(P)-dependent dehydrogenase (short-subunit alcohol dehydrogenase family)